MAKRRYGTGTVTERSPGVWQARIPDGTDPVTGRHRRSVRTFHAESRQHAEEVLAILLADHLREREDVDLGYLLRRYFQERGDLTVAQRQALMARIEAAIETPARPVAPIVGTLPTEPGWMVYVARDEHHRALYVGMTGNLWSRMGQWRQLGTWWQEAARVEWHACQDQAEAAQLERRLIVQHDPPYNTTHRGGVIDDGA